MTEQNSLISCTWRSNRLDVTWLSVFCKILLKLDFLLLTSFWLQSPSTVKFLSLCLEIFPHKTAPEKWLKMTVIYLVSLHQGVLSVPSPVKTKPLYDGPFGSFLMLFWATRLSFHSHHLQGWLRSVGTGSPPAPRYLLSPNSAGHSPAALRDAEHIPVCCYLLLQCTCTQKRSPFIHLQAFHLLPRPTPAFTPQLTHQHFPFKINFTDSSSLPHDPCLCEPFHLAPFCLSSPIKKPLLIHIHWPKNEGVNK